MLTRFALAAILAPLLALCLGDTALGQPVLGEKLSHSKDSSTVDAAGSIICTPDQPWPQQGWMRVYDPAQFGVTGDIEIVSVDFGWEGTAGTGETEQDGEVIFYEVDSNDLTIEFPELTELQSETITLDNDDDETVVTYTLDEPLVIESGMVFAVEIRHPDLDGAISTDDREFTVGANDGGQTAPSYYVRGDPGLCADIFTDPFNLEDPLPGSGAVLGPIHLIIDVGFVGGCVPPSGLSCEAVGDDFELNWDNNGGYSEIEIFRDGESIAVLDDAADESYTDVAPDLDEDPVYHLLASYVEGDIDCSVESAECRVGVTTECVTDQDEAIGSDEGEKAIVLDFAGSLIITDLDVSVDINHTWNGDVSIDLTSPLATELVLKVPDEDGLERYEDILVTYDDEGLENNTFLLGFGLNMQPIGPGELADFDGELATGEWTLRVDDEVVFDDGTVNGYCLGASSGSTSDFIRGDSDGNGTVSPLLDSLFSLTWQFLGGLEPPCMDAADADGNNSVSAILDSVFLLTFGFLQGPVPPDPGPDECGPDDDLDTDIGCESGPAICL